MSNDNLTGLSESAGRATNSSLHTLHSLSQRLSLARIILIALVVYVHVPLDLPSDRNIYSMGVLEPAFIAKETLLRFSVTILTVMSGFLLFATRADRKGMITIKKKVKTVLVPFLFWNLPLVAALYLGQRLQFLSGQRLNLLTADARIWADAVLAWSARPANYPLYFLRDLFVISVIGVAVSRIARANIAPVIAVCAIIAAYNLDGNIILRTPMLVAFFVGAAFAIYDVPLYIMDKSFKYLVAILLVSCAAQYYNPSQTGDLLITILGGLTIWTSTALVSRSTGLQKLAQLARFAFPIYLIHGIVLFIVLATGVEISNSILGLILWLVMPAAIAIVSALLFRLFSRLLPQLASFSIGGRDA